MWTSDCSYPEIVKPFLIKGPISTPDMRMGGTALMEAAWNGSLAVVRILLDKGEDVNVKDNQNQPALMLAIDRDNLEIAKVLKSNRAKDDVGLGTGPKDSEPMPNRIFSLLW
jgi:ankyrin repeat protein